MEIKLKNVTVIKNEKTPFQKTILKNINLGMKKEQIIAIMGSGKSTLAKVIAGLEGFQEGNIKKTKMRIGYLCQNSNEYLYQRTVREELELGMKGYKYRLAKKNKRIMDVLKMFGLNENILEKNPLNISSSEQKKIMLASLLIFNPEVIILDEFDAGLTNHDKELIKKLLKNIKNKYNKIIIVISNDLAFLNDFYERIIVINNGEIVLDKNSKILENQELYAYFEMPKIIEFIKYLNSLGHRFKDYSEINELIKAVYRSVK